MNNGVPSFVHESLDHSSVHRCIFNFLKMIKLEDFQIYSGQIMVILTFGQVTI